MIKTGKIKAAASYCDGFCHAIGHPSGPADFNDALFMEGYRYGRKIQKEFIVEMNIALVTHGFEEIQKVKLMDEQSNL